MTHRFTGLRTVAFIFVGAFLASAINSTLASSADAADLARTGIAGHFVERMIEK